MQPANDRRESKALSFAAVERLISASLNAGRSDTERLWPTEVYDDRLIYEDSGRYFERTYAINEAEDQATLGDAREVEKSWRAKGQPEAAGGGLLELGELITDAKAGLEAMGVAIPPTGAYELKDLELAEYEVKTESGGTPKSIEGTVAGIGNEDTKGDVIELGAFDKTIAERIPAGKVKLLADHVWTTDHLLGTFRRAWVEAAKGVPASVLGFAADVVQGVPSVDEIMARVVQKHVEGMSIGYVTKAAHRGQAKSAATGRPIRHLTELKWYEGSVLPFQANELATISGYKDAGLRVAGQIEALAETLSKGDPTDPAQRANIQHAIATLEAILAKSDGKTAPPGDHGAGVQPGPSASWSMRAKLAAHAADHH